jgi:23S rRNA (guanosine2251-2'-O)-methyltransferase
MKLLKKKKKHSTRLLAGIHPVWEALQSDASLERVYLLKSGKNPRLFQILKTCRKKKISVSLVPKNRLDNLARDNHQGVVASVSFKKYSTMEQLFLNARKQNTPPLIIVPEGVEDPQNLGALIRTGCCAGVHGIVVPAAGSAGLTEGTAKAAAGAIEHMDICRMNNMPQVLTELKARGLQVIGLEAGQGKPLWDLDLTVPLALVLGSESRGIRPHIRRKLDTIATIPISGPVTSLNVSAAGAAALFEVARQRLRARALNLQH